MAEDAVEATVTISMADIGDDALITEYWRRFPWDWAEEIQTILDTDPKAATVDPAMLDKLSEWIKAARSA